jgi:predicted hotdog family 3-hydroxylacyl-ACP dehydratase
VSGDLFPPVEQLVPHAGPMCLLSRVIEHNPGRTVCAAAVSRSEVLADPDGCVPVWVGLEYMAQCIAVHGGLSGRARGEPPRPGLFLGSRRVQFSVPHFSADQQLLVSASHHAGERGLVAFDCEIHDISDSGGSPLVRGRANVYIVDSWQEFGGSAAHGG